MSCIRVLKAKHGDSFIIECEREGNKGVVVVDGGPGSCRVDFKKALASYEVIDLMVLTHFDEDHIGGILSYVTSKKKEDYFPVKEMWVNSCSSAKIDDDTNCSYGQAMKLSEALSEISSKTGLVWMPFVTEKSPLQERPFAEILVLSPAEDTLVENVRRLKGRNDCNLSASSRSNDDLKCSLEELSKREKKEPHLGENGEEIKEEYSDDIINASSIAFLLKCDGLSILMLGDSFPQNVENKLRQEYSEENPLKVDYVKVSHHGSRNNISNTLLDIIDCNNFIISTNGGKGIANHPDRETIANILCHPKRNKEIKVHLFFNYPQETIEKNGVPFLKEEDESLNFETHYDVTTLP